MKYLSARHILFLHSLVLEKDGGMHGVRDYHALLNLENLPRQSVFGKELYPTIFEKAAVLARGIIMNHPFIDGNKRTGMTAASVFLENNKYYFMIKEGEIEKFALKIIKDRLSIEDIAGWFRKNSKQSQKSHA